MMEIYYSNAIETYVFLSKKKPFIFSTKFYKYIDASEIFQYIDKEYITTIKDELCH